MNLSLRCWLLAIVFCSITMADWNTINRKWADSIKNLLIKCNEADTYSLSEAKICEMAKGLMNQSVRSYMLKHYSDFELYCAFSFNNKASFLPLILSSPSELCRYAQDCNFCNGLGPGLACYKAFQTTYENVPNNVNIGSCDLLNKQEFSDPGANFSCSNLISYADHRRPIGRELCNLHSLTCQSASIAAEEYKMMKPLLGDEFKFSVCKASQTSTIKLLPSTYTTSMASAAPSYGSNPAPSNELNWLFYEDSDRIIKTGCRFQPDQIASCSVVSSLMNKCIYECIREPRSVASKAPKNETAMYIWSRNNPANDEICPASFFVSDLLKSVRSQLVECDHETLSDVMFSEKVASLDEQRSKDLKMSEIISMGTGYDCPTQLKARTRMLCSRSSCSVKITSTIESVIFEAVSSGPAKLTVMFGKQMKTDVMTGKEGRRSIQFTAMGWGEYSYQVKCNSMFKQGVLILTRKQFCNQNEGVLRPFYVWYCMNPHKATISLALITTSVLLWMCSPFFGIVIGFLILFLTLIPSLCCRKCRKRCSNCSKVFFTRKSLLDHDCLEVCKYCNCSIKNQRDHLERCRCSVSTEEDVIKRESREFQNWVKRIVIRSSGRMTGSLLLFCAILIIFGFIQVSESLPISPNQTQQMESMIDFNRFLHQEGFSPSEIMFSGNDYQRTTLSFDHETKQCTVEGASNVCHSNLVLDLTIKLIPGFQAGYIVSPTGSRTSSFNLDVRVIESEVEKNALYQYTTCETTMFSRSSDTCTDGCEQCFKQVDKEILGKKVSGEVCLSGTSTWACDGPGCLSISSGSTCGKCYHEAIHGTCYRVLKTSGGIGKFLLCFAFRGKTMCRRMNLDQVQVSKDFGVFPLSSSEGLRDPEIFTVPMNSLRSVFTGPINSRGQFSPQFGSIQFQDSDHLKNPDCISSKDYHHVCQFGRHRKIIFQRCCLDTFKGSIKDLTARSDWAYDEKRGVLTKKYLDLGSARVKITIPHVQVDDLEVKAQITNLEITGSKGCFSCREKADLFLTFESSHTAVVPVSCSGVSSLVDLIGVRKGQNSMSLPVNSVEENPSIHCKVGEDQSAVFRAAFHKDKITYHDGNPIRMSSSWSAPSCESIWCNFKTGTLNLGGNIWKFIKNFFYVVLAALLIGVIIWALWLSCSFCDWKGRTVEESIRDKTHEIIKRNTAAIKQAAAKAQRALGETRKSNIV